MADFDPNRLDGKIAIAFVVISFVLLLIVIATCTICWCWRYKLHKRKAELKAKELEQGLIPTKKSSGCCRCCGCWMYCCRCCLGCCDDNNPKPVYSDAVVVVQPVDPVLPTGGGGCSGGAGKDNFGWSRDVYVYNGGGPGTGGCGGCGSPVVSSGGGRGGCGCSGGGGGAQPVNFNGRWSVPTEPGRLVLGAGGGGGLASHVIPGASPYGGIVPSTTNLYTKIARRRY